MPEFPELCEPKSFTVDEQAAIDELKCLFATRNDISFQRDDYFLTKFLRFCDWNAEKAFIYIVNFYELKHLNPQHYAQKNVSEYIDILSTNSRVLLDKRDKCGRTVFVGKLGNVTPNMQYTDAAIIDDLWIELLLSDPTTQKNGISIITDCKGMSTMILKWLSPKNCKVGAAKLEMFPVKDWTIHLVNMGPIFKACVMLVKPFLRKQTLARFHFHNNGFNELHEFLGKECLPNEYGGTNGPIDYEKSLKFLLMREKMLERNRQFGFKQQL